MDSACKLASRYTGRMHIGIDIREACRPRKAGKGQWVMGFVQELLKRDEELTLFTDAALPNEWQKMIEQKSVIHLYDDRAPGLRWHWKVARAVKKNTSIDLYVSPTSFIVPFLLGRSKRVVPIVHDLIAFRHEPHDRKATLIEKLTLGRAVASAHCVYVMSETTKHDLCARYPVLDPSRIIPIFAAPMGAAYEKTSDDGSILCIATLCPRKNQKRLIEAYAMLPADLRSKHRLILVGARGWHDEQIVKLASSTPGVEWKSYLRDDECRALMTKAMVFTFPSLYEGFGMPIVEAMRAGVPVLTSNVGSMKEVAGNAALLIDPTDVDAMRNGLRILLSDASLREDLAHKGRVRAQEFSWKKTVDLFLAGINRYPTEL